MEKHFYRKQERQRGLLSTGLLQHAQDPGVETGLVGELRGLPPVSVRAGTNWDESWDQGRAGLGVSQAGLGCHIHQSVQEPESV